MMKKFGYAYDSQDKSYLSRQLEALGGYHCDEIILETEIDSAKTHPDMKLVSMMKELSAGDELVIYELLCLGNSMIQLKDFFKELKEKEITLKILKEDPVFSALSTHALGDLFDSVAKMEKEIIRMRTARGLKVARENERVGGRPRVSPETIAKIETLYLNNKHTLRQIAEECDISLGTAYKYTQGR